MFIQDGYRSVFIVAGFPNILLRERELQPPEADARGMIDTTTMLNRRLITKVPKHLIDFGDMTAQCNYDPFVYSLIINTILGRVLLYTVVFPDAATMSFYAAMHKFTPASLREGEFPLAEVKVGPVNRNSIGAEALPTITGVNVASLAWPPVPRP